MISEDYQPKKRAYDPEFHLISHIFQDLEIDEEFELLVLASDGLWDVVPNEVIPPPFDVR